MGHGEPSAFPPHTPTITLDGASILQQLCASNLASLVSDIASLSNLSTTIFMANSLSLNYLAMGMRRPFRIVRIIELLVITHFNHA